MIIRLSKRDLSRLLNEGSLEGAGRELRLSKRAFEVVNWVQLPVPWNELFSCPACVVDRPSHYWVKSGVCTPWNKSPDQPIYIFISPFKRFFTLTGNWAKMLFKFVVQSSIIVDQQKNYRRRARATLGLCVALWDLDTKIFHKELFPRICVPK